MYRKKGWRAYWAARLQDLRGVDSDPLYNYDAGSLALRAGFRDRAIGFFKRAVDEHCY